MNGDDECKLFYLKNREFSMDIDVSHLECGMNGAMYFVEMDEQGGKGLGHNQAGAKYGTGYCDAQCPHDIKFIEGEARPSVGAPIPKTKMATRGVVSMAVAVRRRTFGKLTVWQARLLHIHARWMRSLANCDAKVFNAVTLTRVNVTRACVTKMVATSILSGWGTSHSMAKDLDLQWTRRNP